MHCSAILISASRTRMPAEALVSSLMQLAGEVAARWCHGAGVPIPYRAQRSWVRRISHAIDALTRNIFYPQLVAPESSHRRNSGAMLWALIGTQGDTTPAPLYTMGSSTCTPQSNLSSAAMAI